MTDRKINRRQWLAQMAAITGAAVTALPLSGAAVAHTCSGCGRCMPCPYGVDIPAVFRFHDGAADRALLPDDSLTATSPRYRDAARRYLTAYDRAIDHTHQAHRCIQCGRCIDLCRRGIAIDQKLAQITAMTDKMRDSLCYE